MNQVNVLHLSDLHFGVESHTDYTKTALAQRKLTLKGLVKILESLDASWRPDIIAVTGDIGWRAASEDYKQAKAWLRKVLKTLALTPKDLVVCAGNHDLDREETLGSKPPVSSTEADEWLRVDRLKYFVRPFEGYQQFCKDMKMPQPALDKEKLMLAGQRTIKGLRVVVLNSAWFCRGDEDEKKLWLGLPQLKVMAASGQLAEKEDYDTTDITLAIFHHTPGWLNEAEYNSYDGRINTVRYLSDRCHMMLCGHVHGALEEPHREFNRALLFSGGSSYSGDHYQNNFSIFKIDLEHRKCVRRGFEFDPRHGKWEEKPPDGPGSNTYSLKMPVVATVEAPSPPPQIPERYSDWLFDHCKDMDVTRLIGTSPAIRVRLPELFVPLKANPPGEKSKGKTVDDHPMGRESAQDIEELIKAHEYLLIEGQAGSGKTTLIKHFAYLTLQADKHKEWEPYRGFLPVLVFLKNLKGFGMTEASAGVKSAEALLSYYADITENGLDAETILQFCKTGKAIFLLDGLDEIDAGLRGFVAGSFAALRRQYKECKIVLSGRPHGVDETVVQWYGDKKVSILRLGIDQVEAFINKWFCFVYDTAECRINKTAQDMIGEIKAHPSIDELRDNPLMLTAICLLYNDKKELPGQRADLYDKFVENLLYRRFSDPEKVLNFLMKLAHDMHERRVRGIDELRAIDILESEYKPKKDASENHGGWLKKKFAEIEPGCGLLQVGAGEYEFRHLTFQEFLTAVHIAAGVRKDHAKAIEEFWGDDWYAEVVQLYIGYLSINNRGIANEIVREVLAGEDPPPCAKWRLAARALMGVHKDNRDDDVVELAGKRMVSMFEQGVDAKVRADAGEIIGWLGDPKDLETFKAVKTGRYKLSTGEVEIKPFEMSTYPVTNQWYAKFIQAGGYTTPEYWSEEGKKWRDYVKPEAPRFWYDRPWNCPNAPVVGVSWYEADAFCRWLTLSRKDGAYRLPDENQWEAAAAGFENRTYAWGNEFDKNKCNIGESGIEKTSAVGIFNAGNTPEGIADLTGNVWEWTCSDIHGQRNLTDFVFDSDFQKLYDENRMEEYFSISEKKDLQQPVLRGGSWFNDLDYARCAIRYGNHPDDRYNNIGFRCVRT
jgi:formylglycine-generating enzyme required for sulfatase activity/energy-coupling factor transporter ATP-binding protein EcfA2